MRLIEPQIKYHQLIMVSVAENTLPQSPDYFPRQDQSHALLQRLDAPANNSVVVGGANSAAGKPLAPPAPHRGTGLAFD
jgi:hypothetical protein